ncbi:MAG TPA: hypothetical protein VFD41_03340, partial [Actinomycetales bacterium]|nr:hypothetical protein [Actinomycetales bacterium]
LDSENEIVDNAGNFVYRYNGDEIITDELTTKCLKPSQSSLVVAISNMPSGDLTVLDAGYEYDLVKTNRGQGSKG